MCDDSLRDITCFADVVRIVSTAQYVDEPHATTMPSSAEEWKWMEEVVWPFPELACGVGPSTALGMTLSLSKGQGILPDGWLAMSEPSACR